MVTDRNKNYMKKELIMKRAFYQLLQEKHFSKIKAIDVIRASGVNSATFYNHFPGGIIELRDKVVEDGVNNLRVRLQLLKDCLCDKENAAQLIDKSLFPELSVFDFENVVRSMDYIDYLDREVSFLTSWYSEKQKGNESNSSELAYNIAAIRSHWGSLIELLYCFIRGIVKEEHKEAYISFIKKDIQFLTEIVSD